MLTDDQKRIVAGYANRLPFVTWDRHISYRTDLADGAYDTGCTLYGWIARDDGRSDFVVLVWHWMTRQQFPWSTTSSAEHSAEISRALYHDLDWWTPEEHVECVRAEDVFDGLVDRMVRLS